MKTIVIVTSSYPYPDGKEDSFLRREIEELSNQFKIVLVPLKSKTLDRDKFIENLQNISVIDSFCNVSFLRMALAFLKDFAFVSPILFEEIKGKNLSELLKLFLYYIRVHWIKINIENNLTNFLVDRTTIFYTYWFGQGTTALVELKKKFDFILITRAHGSDLYLSQNSGYIPFRNSDLKDADQIITISKMGESYLKTNYNIDKVKTFYLGVSDPNAIVEIIPDKTLRLVSCSNLITLKRVDLIYVYLKMYSEEHNIEIIWHHIGEGELSEYFNSIVVPLGSNLRLKFAGSLPNNEIVKYYLNNSFDYFITLSSSEGLPVSLMEACSCGLPCIATNVGGIAELVLNNINGFLMSSDPSYHEFEYVLTEAIQKKNNLNEYSSMKKKCYDIFEDKFNSKNNYKDFSDFLIGIL
jgi:glycosyltransferase involved in cell wall biosynthesis